MATKKANAAGPAGKGLRVVARPDTFWRAGLKFTHEPRVIPLDELSADQVEEIKGEPLLVVAEVDIAAEPDTPQRGSDRGGMSADPLREPIAD